MSSAAQEIKLDITSPGNADVKPINPKSSDSPPSVPAGNAELKRNPVIHSLGSHFGKFRKKLRECCTKNEEIDSKGGETDEEKERKEQQKAYKKLMDDLEGEPKEDPVSVIMWIVNVLLFLLLIVFLVTTRSIHQIHTQWFLNMRIHSWVAFLIVIVSGYPFIRFSTFVISEPIIWFRKTDMFTMFYVRKLKKSIDVTLWFALVLWVWYTWYRPEVVEDTRGAHTLQIPVDEYSRAVKIAVKQITRLLLALTLGALIWVLKSLLFLKLQASLYFKELCPKISQTILDFHGIMFIETQKYWEYLQGRGKSKNSHTNGSQKDEKNEGNANSHDAGKDEAATEETMTFWMCVSHLDKETAPIWILKRLIYTYMEHMKKKPEILKRMEAIHDDDKLMDKAREMLNQVTGGRDSGINRQDLISKYHLNDKELNRIFQFFTSEENGNQEQIITQDQFLRWAVLAAKNCLGLERTIASSRRIFWKLNVLMSSGVVVLTLVIWLLLSEIVTTAQIAILFAPFVSASFIFGESLKRTFDSLIFVFGIHPFDAGNRVIIENVEMKVKELNILTTIFIKYDTGEELIYPNYQLATKSIVNLDIRPDQSDSIEFTIPITTPLELIRNLQFRIQKTLDDDLTFTSDTTVAMKKIDNTDGITFIVHFKYLVSYLSVETQDMHRSKIFSMIIKLRKKVEELENEIKSIKEEPSKFRLIEVKFKFDQKEKLEKFDPDLIQKELMSTVQNHGQSVRIPHVVITGIDINKKKIRMAVHLWYLGTEDQAEKLKKEIEEQIKTHGGLEVEQGNTASSMKCMNDYI